MNNLEIAQLWIIPLGVTPKEFLPVLEEDIGKQSILGEKPSIDSSASEKSDVFHEEMAFTC